MTEDKVKTSIDEDGSVKAEKSSKTNQNFIKKMYCYFVCLGHKAYICWVIIKAMLNWYRIVRKDENNNKFSVTKLLPKNTKYYHSERNKFEWKPNWGLV